MKIRILAAIVCGVVLSPSVLSQVPSRFDFSGNLSFNGATLPTAPSSTQVRAFGWQTSGVTRFSRWLSVTSQFGSGYASADSIQLVGYTGPGKMIHYSMLAGPRITIPTRSRFAPFIEGLAGGDRASTSLVSNGTVVTGREWQTAYAFGGGAQINLSRHFGLNFEGQYFGTQHTTAFTGWQPSHFQVAAGIVIRMLGRSPQIAEQRPLPMPTTGASADAIPVQTGTETRESEASRTAAIVTVQPVIPTPTTQVVVQPQATVASETQIASIPSATITPAAAVKPSAPAVAVQAFPTAKVAAPAPQVVASAPPVSTPLRQIPTPTQPVVTQTTQTVGGVHQSAAQPAVQSSPQARQPAVTTYAATVPQASTQSAPPPMSLGEYARRLREKKQQEAKQ